MSDTVDWESLRIMSEAGLTPEQIRALNPNDPLNRAYGYAAALADIPELKAILDQAVAEQWTPDMIVAAINNSEWAKGRRQAQIDYEVNRRVNPADVAAQRENLEIYIQEQVTKLGMTHITQARIDTMSGWALKNGFTPAEIDRMIQAEVRFDPQANYGIAHGDAASILSELKAKAKAFMVPISDAALTTWVNQILKGEQVMETYDEWLRTSAKSMFPMLAGQIDAGFDTITLLSPYQQMAQQELGLFQVDLSQPDWISALMRTDEKGVRTMATLDEFRQYLRTDTKLGWDKTVHAQEMTAELGVAIAEEMGARR